MRSQRSSTHQQFSVRTAGWFTVLKSDGWFPALHFPGRYHVPDRPSSETSSLVHANRNEITYAPQIMSPAKRDRRIVRPALIILTAMMLTSALLWWTMHP